MKLFLDIETLPDLSADAKDRARAALKPPANYKNADTIEKWKDENADEAWRKTSFDGGYGSICVIGYAIEDDPAQAIIVNDEKRAIDAMAKIIFDSNHKHGAVEWVGHNILGFDLPFLWKRSVILGAELRTIIPKDARHGTGRAFCTMQAWAGFKNYISLDSLASILGLKSHKSDFDGSMIYDAWMAGEKAKVAEYCLNDVELARKIYNRIM